MYKDEKDMIEHCKIMRPYATSEQMLEAVRRTLEQIDGIQEGEEAYVLEFHLDDVLGHGDEEYAYPPRGEEE